MSYNATVPFEILKGRADKFPQIPAAEKVAQF